VSPIFGSQIGNVGSKRCKCRKPPSNPLELAMAGEPPHFQTMMSQFTTPPLSVVAALVALISTAACGSNPSPAAPSAPSAAPAPVPFPTSTFHLTGIATDDDGNPVAGATVTIKPWIYGNLNPPTVSGMTDGRGFYSIDFDAYNPGGIVGLVNAESAGHDPSHYFLKPSGQNASQNIHLYRIKRITAGESTVLTVLPSDTFCGDDDGFLCRTVHIVAPSDGLMTLEAVPTPSAANAGLEILGQGVAHYCCSLTASVPVTAGTEVIANIGEWFTSTASQSFMFNTSLVGP